MLRIWFFRDVTKLHAQKEILHHQAYHDSLTDLPNRAYILEALDHAISLAKRNNDNLGVMFIDLDDFKKINDTSGHDVGDKFLINAAQKIKLGLRQGDTIARIGGDEFLVILEQVNRQKELTNIANTLLSLLDEPSVINNNIYRVSCSIGISLFPHDGDTGAELIRKADMAMYSAKKSGKNIFHYFDPNLERLAIHRVEMENQIRQGLSNNEFDLAFQPKICLETQNIVSVEALVRWVRPDNRVIYPGEFIPIAESEGFIKDITQLVLIKGCETLESWSHTQDKKRLGLSINISAIDITDSSFFDRTKRTLEHFKFDKQLLEFELTESVFLEEKHNAQKIIDQLKSLGIKISIDDFGSGYANFAYLMELNIDCLKIDKSLTQKANSSPRSAAILKSIVDIGTHLDMLIVAEGVETESELEFLVKTGCNCAQGFFYSKPLFLNNLEEFFKQWQTNPAPYPFKQRKQDKLKSKELSK